MNTTLGSARALVQVVVGRAHRTNSRTGAGLAVLHETLGDASVHRIQYKSRTAYCADVGSGTILTVGDRALSCADVVVDVVSLNAIGTDVWLRALLTVLHPTQHYAIIVLNVVPRIAN